MALNLAAKKKGWLSRVTGDVIAAVDALNVARTTALEYTTDAFNGGDLGGRPEYQITDQDLADLGFSHLSAAKLNAFIGGLNQMTAAYDANAGVIEAGRP